MDLGLSSIGSNTWVNHYDPIGYPWLAVLEGNTPAAFRAALMDAWIEAEHAGGPARLVTLNAWNEWTEGSCLLPDTVHGTAYLEAVRDVFGAPAPTPAPGARPTVAPASR